MQQSLVGYRETAIGADLGSVTTVYVCCCVVVTFFAAFATSSWPSSQPGTHNRSPDIPSGQVLRPQGSHYKQS